MAAADHRGDLFFSHGAVWYFSGIGADPAFSGKGQRGLNCAIGNGGCESGTILAANARVMQGASHPARAKPSACHCLRPRIAKGAVINIPRRRESLGNRCYVGHCPVKAALPYLAVQIGGQPRPCGRETLDITERQPFQSGAIKGFGWRPGNTHAIIVPHSHWILNACSGQSDRLIRGFGSRSRDQG